MPQTCVSYRLSPHHGPVRGRAPGRWHGRPTKTARARRVPTCVGRRLRFRGLWGSCADVCRKTEVARNTIEETVRLSVELVSTSRRLGEVTVSARSPLTPGSTASATVGVAGALVVSSCPLARECAGCADLPHGVRQTGRHRDRGAGRQAIRLGATCSSVVPTDADTLRLSMWSARVRPRLTAAIGIPRREAAMAYR